MNRILHCAALVFLTLVTATAFGQDLAAAARQARERQKKAPPAKVWTNDDFATMPAPAPEPPAADAVKPAAEKSPDTPAKPPAAEGKAKAGAAMQKQVDAQKDQIALLSRELDIAQREFKLQVANYYADAGNSLRDPKKWADQRDAKQKEIDNKQAALDAAKAKLADLLEQARKAGIRVNE